MTEILLSAISSSFLMVRIIKGPWRRNPQYLAVSIAGAILAILAMHAFSPGMEDELVAGSIAGFGGSWAGMLAFDAVLGMG